MVAVLTAVSLCIGYVYPVWRWDLACVGLVEFMVLGLPARLFARSASTTPATGSIYRNVPDCQKGER